MGRTFFLLLSFILLIELSSPAEASVTHRFYLEGDGRVRLINAKTGKGSTFTYRNREGYVLKALDDINGVFGLKTAPDEFIHPRLIALLDYLQDQLKGGVIRITSGYRSPIYNEGLRKKGRLAARTSLHIEGMAADIDMDLIDGKTLWEFVRSLDCCGAGFYHGKGIHVDVGPSRFWDETSTKVEQDLGAHNKLVLVSTNFDVYEAGEKVYMTLGRVTDYPFGIRPTVMLVHSNGPGGKEIRPIPVDTKDLIPSPNDKTCLIVRDRAAARSIEFDLPKGFDTEDKIQVRIDFCEKPFEDMPDLAASNAFSIRP